MNILTLLCWVCFGSPRSVGPRNNRGCFSISQGACVVWKNWKFAGKREGLFDFFLPLNWTITLPLLSVKIRPVLCRFQTCGTDNIKQITRIKVFNLSSDMFYFKVANSMNANFFNCMLRKKCNTCVISWVHLKNWGLLIWDPYFEGRMQNCSAWERVLKKKGMPISIYRLVICVYILLCVSLPVFSSVLEKSALVNKASL